MTTSPPAPTYAKGRTATNGAPLALCVALPGSGGPLAAHAPWSTSPLAMGKPCSAHRFPPFAMCLMMRPLLPDLEVGRNRCYVKKFTYDVIFFTYDVTFFT